MTPIDKLFDNNSQPLRRNGKFQQKLDANGTPTFEALEGDAVTLSSQGSIDHAHVVGFHSCGHPTTAGLGGKCMETGCQNTSCPICYARCGFCHKGLCLLHRREIQSQDSVPSGSAVPTIACPECKEQIERRRRMRKLVRLVLSPFVEFGS